MIRAKMHEPTTYGVPLEMPDDSDSNWGRYLGIGLEIAVGVLLGYFVGAWLDRRYGWKGYGTLGGVMIGIAAGMYLLIKDAIRINKD
jgi:F0F1-type ATP synthase assembly protein I